MPDFNKPALPPDQAPPIEQMPAAGKAAIERDKAWFRANPHKTRRQRRVRRRELPPSLRKFDIASVLIERAGPAHFVRTWFNSRGRPVVSGFDEYDDPVVPDAPDRTMSFLPQGNSVRCVVDAGTAGGDREWFEQHPDKTVRVRPMTAEEAVEVETPPGFVVTEGTATVTKIADGRRSRQLDYKVAAAENVQ
jgi:hypothetical protein